MMNRFFIFLFLSSLAVSLKAQTFQGGQITGKVIDPDGRSVSAVTIVLRHTADSALYRTSLSNRDGMFSMEKLSAGGYFVEIIATGREMIVRNGLSISEKSSRIDLGVNILRNSAILLSGVTIKPKIPFIESRADKIIVNMANDIIAQGSAVMEVMDILPGVRVNPDEQISLNGKSVTIFIDGKATFLSGDALKGLLKGMPSSSIERIELIANPSSKFDAAGNGGIINIVRKKNSKTGLIGSVYGGIQQWNNERNNVGLILNSKGKAYNLFLNADYAYNRYFMDASLISDLFNSDSSLKMRSLSDMKSVRNSRSIIPSFGIDYYLTKKATISLTGTESIQTFSKLGSTGMDVLNGQMLKLNSYDLTNNVDTRSSNFSSNVHLLYQMDSTAKELTVDLDYANFVSSSDQDNADTKNDASGSFVCLNQTLLEQDMNWDIYAAKIDFTHRLKDGNLEAGLKSGYVKSKNKNEFYNLISGNAIIDPSRNDQFSYSENINSLYINLNKKFDKFSFQSGVRAEQTRGSGRQQQNGEGFSNNYSHIFPSLALDYKVSKNHSLNIHINKRINRPNYENLNPLIRIVNSSNYTGGNPNLKPVISYNSSLGYSFKDMFFTTFSYTRNFHDNISLTVPFNNEGIAIRRPGNNRYTDFFSLYMAWSQKITSWYTAGYNVSLTKQAFKSNADNYYLSSTGTPAFNLNSYQSFTLNQKWSFQALIKYQGRFQEMSRTTKPNYYVVAGVRRSIFGNRGAISVNMSDIFNTYSARYTDNSPVLRQIWDNRYDVRLIRPNFTYSFGKGKIRKVNTGDGASEEKTRTSVKEN